MTAAQRDTLDEDFTDELITTGVDMLCAAPGIRTLNLRLLRPCARGESNPHAPLRSTGS